MFEDVPKLNSVRSFRASSSVWPTAPSTPPIANFLTIADQVIGAIGNDEFAVSLRLAVQLDDQSSGQTLQYLDLCETDGACGPLNDWISGDFGMHPVAHTRSG